MGRHESGTGPSRIATTISEQPIDIRHATEKSPCADVVADVSGDDEEIERSAFAIVARTNGATCLICRR